MRRLIPAVAALLLALLPPVARADGDWSLNDSYRATLRGGGIVSEGIGLAVRSGAAASGSIQIAGVPAGAQIERAFLYWAVLAADDSSVVFNGQSVTGPRIGRSPDTCWFGAPGGSDPAHDNRVYRADVSGLVGGNGTYAVSGVGNGTGVLPGDAQGASLVVVYSQPDATYETQIVINDGAISGVFPRYGMEHTFRNLFDERATQALRLHVGVGDTQAEFDDGAMKFAGATVLPANQFAGSDGAGWDDHTLDLQPSLLPPFTHQASNRIDIVDDCQVWAYAALEIRRNLPPVVITSPSPDEVVGRDVTVIGVTIGDEATQVRVAQGETILATVPVVDTAWTASITMPGGYHTITATGLDAGGNPLPRPAQVSFNVDADPPSVEITAPRPAAASVGIARIAGTSNDNHRVDRIQVAVEDLARGTTTTVVANCFGCGGPAASWEARVPLNAGVYRVTATAFDAVGNSKTTPPFTFIANVFPG